MSLNEKKKHTSWFLQTVAPNTPTDCVHPSPLYPEQALTIFFPLLGQ